MLENGADINCITKNSLDVFYFLNCSEVDNLSIEILNLLNQHKNEYEKKRKLNLYRDNNIPKRVKTTVEKKNGAIYLTVKLRNQDSTFNSKTQL